MKRLWIGIGLLVAFLVLGLVISLLFADIHRPLEQGITAALVQAEQGNWLQARQILARTRQEWERYRPFVAAVADHAPLEELEACLDELWVYGALERRDEFAALCARTAGLAQAMGDSQQLTWWNLL